VGLVADKVLSGSPASRAAFRPMTMLTAVDDSPVSLCGLERQLYRTGSWEHARYFITRDGIPPSTHPFWSFPNGRSKPAGRIAEAHRSHLSGYRHLRSCFALDGPPR